ncbi:hypothetical protein K435DRAFT_789841 [Dendrothele bispora CBS 962.96]|uniref:Uncharacterized protein n=1 Tax=Dendrothele bispora (strain CBS 962.96) TaxID=1314807 RepID=A0A4S8MT18_DENBC|nr:hypothetical protein K435DRAFT_789841 [Dendrothele bispora CBS 962.96]
MSNPTLPDPEKGTEAGLYYELPPFIKSVKEGWHSSLQVAALVSTLFAGTAAQFLGTVKGATNGIENSAKTILLITSYGGIIFNYSATIGALCLSDRVASFPLQANFKRFDKLEIQPQLKQKPIGMVLSQVNAGKKTFIFFYVHCELNQAT